MTNVDTTGTEKAKKKGVALHQFLDASGQVVGINKGIGIKYTDKASGKTFDYMIPDAVPGKILTMFALFGAKTKATNETSRLRNSDSGNGRDTDAEKQINALIETFGEIQDDTWREEGETVVGANADRPTLAAALVELGGEKAKSVAEYLARMESEDGYVAKVYGNKAVKDVYLRLRREASGKTLPSVDDLL